jgi:UDP-sulfoquinovose synthase
MKICVLGGDGYLGWPTSLYLSRRGHDVLIIDNFVKRRWEAEFRVAPLIPIPSMGERIDSWKHHSGRAIGHIECDISTDYETLETALREFAPDAIVHYAEQPSAPYSMVDRLHAIETQRNNVIGTLNLTYAIRAVCPDSHLVKLGTMGEYGTPKIDIEEGWLEVEHKGRRDRVLFPKKPGSIYHLSKVHDSANLEFACRTWGIKVTDLNQGIVYGVGTDETGLGDGLHTSFHYDSIFGTVLNRFVVQAVAGIPLTIYGRGQQMRGFINVRDTIRCIEIAALSPPCKGEFRVFNQVTNHFALNDLAQMVRSEAEKLGFKVRINHIANPRVEEESHYYNPKYTALQDLGLMPNHLSAGVIIQMLQTVMQRYHRVDVAQVEPKIAWK